MGKAYPEYGCVCDLDPGEDLTRCTIDPQYDGYVSECSLSTLPSGRIRRSPASCQYWIKRKAYEDSGRRGDDGTLTK